eukprot:TRINITY_DN4799_c0_g2_i1.p1 TRINITY_DN4799_c0_g2~~TRINITY_DN4799_c0_g2_i1.p1  ORF type:complete len:356 (-),score=77.21 TRINITY_DN4799_c0_g2_i1:780-1847(-)
MRSYVLILILSCDYTQSLFLHYFWDLMFPHDRSQSSSSCVGGECMMDLSCRLRYGQKIGQCSFFQVCCNYDETGRSLTQLVRQERKLNFQDYGPVENEKKCGTTGIAARRVVGGSEPGFGAFPWMALIRGGKTRCGGALIRPSWVITAGHCVRNSNWPSMYRVYLGEYNLYSRSEPLPRQKFFVSKVVMHPQYEFTPQADRYDVALLKLDRPATLMPHVSPVCLPSSPQPIGENERTIVAGWGAMKADSVRRPKVLQAVDVMTLNNTECERWHSRAGIRVRIYGDMVCAGHREGGKDACQGDSGGPLMTKNVDGTWMLVGVVSAGYSCAKAGQPGIYHRISESAAWISHVTKNDV